MARLALDRAPAPALPRRFLLSAPLWGALTGVLLLAGGEAAVVDRWSPMTLSAVHMLTLGMLGNVMFGALLQFLPVVAGVRITGGPRAAHLLHALLNLGAAGLVAGFLGRWWDGLLMAAAVLALAFGCLAVMTLPGLWRAAGQALLRTGIAMAILAALVTAALGIGMTVGLSGRAGLPLQPWADIHAGWGVLGWMLVLIASVGRVTMPMFQGTASTSVRSQSTWLLAVLMVLLPGSIHWVVDGEPGALRLGAALLVTAFALAGLWLQWSAPRKRGRPLVRSWRAGLLALLVAPWLLGVGDGMLAGTLAIAVGVPLLVIGMQMEIVAFLGWIGLQRACPRGVLVPSVQQLLPDADKGRVLAWHVAACALLIAAVAWPHDGLARLAGLALLLAYGALWCALRRVGRRSDDFLSSRPFHPPASAPDRHSAAEPANQDDRHAADPTHAANDA